MHDLAHNTSPAPAPFQLVMNVPLTAIHFPVYESVKKLFTADQREEEGLAVQVRACDGGGGVGRATLVLWLERLLWVSGGKG